MNRYDYKHHFGGIILIDNVTQKTIFLQPGDDSSIFLEDVKNTNELFTIPMLIAEIFYFNNDNNN